MTVWVLRDGQLVDRAVAARQGPENMSDFPTPHVSRMTPFESPVTGADITTWRERDADMAAAGAFDARDLGPDHVFEKGRQAQQKDAENARRTDDIWTGTNY